MTEQEFLQNASLEALLVAYANSKPYKTGYVVESSYREGKYSNYELSSEIRIENNQLLSEFAGLPFELDGSHHRFVIQSKSENDDFFAKLYRRIQQKRFEDDIDNDEFENIMLLAFFALRGSPDFKMNFYSLDLPRLVVTPKYLDNLFNLLTNLSDLRQLNLNFRELQGQFVSGENRRNTQFRINLCYFYNRVGKRLAGVNRYKYDILQNNREIILSKNIAQNNNKTCVQRILFYTSNVLGQTKTEHEIKQLRKELGFGCDAAAIDGKIKRNQGIVQYVRVYFPDECAACKNNYDIADRSFKYRSSERYYMEIHHCISFSADNTLDQIDNLVKLCPVCHRALTRYRAEEEYQRQLIQQIFNNVPTVRDFCLNFAATEQQAIDFVYERLR